MPEPGQPDARTEELAANLAAVRERIAAACREAGRDPTEVALIVITKTYPAADVLRLASIGVTDIGENRDQEAAPKAAQVGAEGGRLRWHFVGQLQRNKARSVVHYADLVHSVDRVRLVEALDVAVGRYRDGPLDVLVQVSLDRDASRGGAVVDGVEPDVELDRVLASAAAADGLRLRGLMAVAPLGWEPERAFATLADVYTDVRVEHPDMSILSAGMSGDLESAIRYGATHVRVGSAVLGARP